MFSINLDDLYFMGNKTIIKDTIEICRCGYTGEDGFELYLNEQEGTHIVENLVDLSLLNDNVLFGGLVERDLLRLGIRVVFIWNRIWRRYEYRF